MLRGASPWYNPPADVGHQAGVVGDIGDNKPQEWYLVHPLYHKWLQWWDGNIAVCLIFTAFVTPFEVGFLESKVDALFFINRASACTQMPCAPASTQCCT